VWLNLNCQMSHAPAPQALKRRPQDFGHGLHRFEAVRLNDAIGTKRTSPVSLFMSLWEA